MVSRRNYFTIMILMVVVFFLCMTFNTLKDTWNDYEVNPYSETAENYPSKVNIYIPESIRLGKAAGRKAEVKAAEDGEVRIGAATRRRVIGIGDTKGTLMQTAAQWVIYSKRDIGIYESLAAYQKKEKGGEQPELLLIDSESVDWKKAGEITFLRDCVDQGTHLIFCNLPDVSVIRKNREVRELLGIREVREDEYTVDGIHLYAGFLLGGETYYQAVEEEDKGYQDMELRFPWYQLASGTKVYMKGIPEDESIDTEDYPVVIWRKSFGSAYVFAVNGGYMEGVTGLGLLSAMSAEIYSYEIYPAVNAQSMVFEGFPGLADENRKKMDELYSRSVKQVFQEIVWPYVGMSLQDYPHGITCMMAPQYDYRDKNEPDEEQLRYYLKMFHEQAVETGLSAANVSELAMSEKLALDQAFMQEAAGAYDFTSFYAGGMTEKEMEEALRMRILGSVMTVVTDYEEEDAEVIKFLTEDVTKQSTLGEGFAYTYKGDLLMKSAATALGYSNISFDMTRVAYPDSLEDSWENLSRDYAKTVDSFGPAFDGFDGTTATECDVRIRRFLALDYTDSRTGSVIRLETEGGGGPVWFILRTHNESVESVEGGSFKKLEDGAYLIEVEDREAVIRMEPADERYYVMPPGAAR